MWLPAARVVCVTYGLGLTYLLLTPRPLGAAFLHSPFWLVIRPFAQYAHFFSCALLALLMLSARWPIAWRTTLSILLAYGLGTELIQIAVPDRAFEVKDLLQNVTGILTGIAVYRIIAFAVRAMTDVPREDPVVSRDGTAWSAFVRVHDLDHADSATRPEEESSD